MSAESSARILNARLANARDDRELADIVNNAGGGAVDDFNEIHVTTAVGRLAKLTARRKTTTLTWRQRDDVLALLEERLKTLDSIRARNVANLLWSYAKLKYPGNHSVVQCVSDHVLRVVDDFNAMDMANTVWAWATMRYQASDDVLAAMERRTLACLDDFKPQDLANTLWAWATMRYHPSSKVLFAMERRTLACLVDFYYPQALSNIVWAWATMKFKPAKEVLTAMELRMLACIDDFNPQALANTVWACATMRYKPSQEMMSAVERCTFACLDAFNAQNLANMVWACATIRYHLSSRVLASIERRTLECLHNFIPQNLANMVWAWVSMGYQASDDVLAAMERRTLACLDEFSPQDLANTLWAWATMRYHPSSKVLFAMERRMLACIDNLIVPRDLAHTVWAFSMLMNNIEGDNTTYTIDKDVLDRLLHQLDYVAQSSTLDEIDYHQIFQAQHLFGDCFKPSAALLGQAREAWTKQIKSVVTSHSSFEKEVATCLDRLGIAYEVEVITEDGMHRMDMLARSNTGDGDEKLVAIECDGPFHFLRASNGTCRINGSTYARNRDLHNLGLDVLCISVHDWHDMKKDEREAYLSSELHKRDIKHSFKCDATKPTPQASAGTYVPPHRRR